MSAKLLFKGQSLLLAAILGVSLSSISSAVAIDGVQQRERVNDLTHQITWFDNYNQALASAKQKGKPLVWIHMLGKMEGAT